MTTFDHENAPTAVDPPPHAPVGAVPASPMGVGDLLLETWRAALDLGLQAAALMAAAGAVTLLPLALLAVYLILREADPSRSAGTEGVLMLAVFVPLGLIPVGSAAFGAAIGAISRLVAQREARETPSLKDAVAFAFVRLPRLGLATLTTFVLLGVASVVPTGVVAFAAAPLLLTFVPASADAPLRAALGTSAALGRSQYWKLLGALAALAVPYMVLAVLSTALMFAVAVGIGALGSEAAAPGENTDHVVVAAVGAIAAVVLALSAVLYTALALLAATAHAKRDALIHGRTKVDAGVFA